jgi:hypothetical protein
MVRATSRKFRKLPVLSLFSQPEGPRPARHRLQPPPVSLVKNFLRVQVTAEAMLQKQRHSIKFNKYENNA